MNIKKILTLVLLISVNLNGNPPLPFEGGLQGSSKEQIEARQNIINSATSDLLKYLYSLDRDKLKRDKVSEMKKVILELTKDFLKSRSYYPKVWLYVRSEIDEWIDSQIDFIVDEILNLK